MSRPKFLIVGGGFGGVALAKQLTTVADVILLDRKDYFEINIATVRAIVQPGFENGITIPFKDIPGVGRVMIGQIASMTSNSATLQSGETIAFDYAAICTGSTYSEVAGKGTLPSIAERRKQLQDYQTKIKHAKTVVIIGGGPAGIEMAAEILTDLPDKKVTIVHAHERLLQQINKPKFGAKAEAWLKAHGAQLILNKRANIGPGGSCEVDGRPIPADVVLYCTGAKPNTEFLRGGELSQTLDARGFIKVDNQLKVVGYSNLWAIGDCMNFPEAKLGYLAQQHGAFVAKNFKAMLKNGKQATWVANGGMEAMILAMGRKYGVAKFGGWVTAGWLPTMLKSKTLFVDKFRKDVGVAPA